MCSMVPWMLRNHQPSIAGVTPLRMSWRIVSSSRPSPRVFTPVSALSRDFITQLNGRGGRSFHFSEAIVTPAFCSGLVCATTIDGDLHDSHSAPLPYRFIPHV